jgi:hypothetical protein
MSLSNYIEEYGLEEEKHLKSSTTDTSKFSISLQKGVLLINRPAIKKLGLDKNPYVKVFSGKKHGATIFGLEVIKESKGALKASVPKNKQAAIRIAPLLLKYNLSSNKEYKLDLIDCDKGYLVFAILAPKEKEKGLDVAPAPRPEPRYEASGIAGGQESVLPGSDF